MAMIGRNSHPRPTLPSWLGVTLAALVVPTLALADDRRARNNYMLNCQGCHQASAQGLGDQVPRMNGFVGYFTRSEEGRKFLIQVPGSATAPVNDEELAELMNWMLHTFSQDELVEDFVPYTTSEVTRLRRNVEPHPADKRAEILQDLAKIDRDLSQALSE